MKVGVIQDETEGDEKYGKFRMWTILDKKDDEEEEEEEKEEDDINNDDKKDNASTELNE